MHKKIAITIDEQLLAEVDALVAAGVYPNRSQAISLALEEKRDFLRQKKDLRLNAISSIPKKKENLQNGGALKIGRKNIKKRNILG